MINYNVVPDSSSSVKKTGAVVRERRDLRRKFDPTELCMYHLPSNRASKKERQGSSMRQGLNIVTMVLGAVVAAAGMATAILSIINMGTSKKYLD